MESLTALKSPANPKLYKESVVMVHHYGGHKFSFKRQIEYLNSIGFDVYTFDLPASDLLKISRSPISKKGLGLRHGWADDIGHILNSIAGEKFVYSFSSPSAAALTAMAARRFKDIRGWVCDGGPFLDLQTGMSNLVREGEFGGKTIPEKFRDIYSATVGRLLVALFGGINYQRDMTTYLASAPKDFPIISFRALEDKLVYPKMIDDFFALADIAIQPVVLERCPHLAGFRDQPERYKSFLLDYFKRHANLI